MTAPRRIQMTRKRPWRADNPDAVIVDRRTKWGNPFRVGGFLVVTGKRAGQKANASDVVRLFRHYANADQPAAREYRDRARAELAGRDLACWCPLDQPCHADVLLELANPKEQP